MANHLLISKYYSKTQNIKNELGLIEKTHIINSGPFYIMIENTF